MSTGDSNDVFARLKSALPSRWFGSTSDSVPVVDSLLAGITAALSFVYSLYAYAKLQTRMLTASDGWLDMIAADFFGTSIQRKANQTDASFRATIIANMFRERATRNAIVKVLQDLTGRTPKIVEPKRPADTGAYGGHDSITIIGSPQIYRNDWQGNQLLYATARTNWVTQSSGFSNPAWSKIGSGLTLTNGQPAPDGTNTATLLAASSQSSSNPSLIENDTTLSIAAGQQFTCSIFVKQGSAAQSIFNCYVGGDSETNAVIIWGSSPTVSQGLLVPLGSGWYQWILTITAGITGTVNFRFWPAGRSTPIVSGSAYIWGAFAISGVVSGSYIPTTTSAVTVTDYVLSGSTVTLATAPVAGAILSWTGTYASTVQGQNVTVTAQNFAGGDGLTTSFSLAPGYGYAIGYGVAGAYGSMQMPYQAFVIAYRPLGSGIPSVAGYGVSTGGYSQASQAEWASLSMIQQAVTDADIYAAIDSVRPAATIVWTKIQS